MEIYGTCVSKNFDEAVCLESKNREKWIREIKGERLQVIVEGTNSAPRLTSLSAASFPERSECPETQCCLVIKERKESSCQVCQ